MGVGDISFVVLSSSKLHSVDQFYKVFGISEEFFSGKVLRIRILFGEGRSVTARSLANLQLEVGFIDQLFRRYPRCYSASFGLRGKVELFRFLEIFSSGCSSISSFFFYCPEDYQINWNSAGVMGNKFPYLRFLITDVFEFFGSDFFSDFYLDYFNYSDLFAVDFGLTSFVHGGVSWLRLLNSTSLVRVELLKNFLSFYKII